MALPSGIELIELVIIFLYLLPRRIKVKSYRPQAILRVHLWMPQTDFFRRCEQAAAYAPSIARFGKASAVKNTHGAIGKSIAAYFRMVNDQGGINGRKINFISRDDASSPPKTLEVVRKLVEENHFATDP